MAERPLFFREITARCAHKSPANGGRFPHLRAERWFFVTHMSRQKTISIYFAPCAARKSAMLLIFAGGKICDAFWRDLRELLLFRLGDGRELVEQGEA